MFNKYFNRSNPDACTHTRSYTHTHLTYVSTISEIWAQDFCTHHNRDGLMDEPYDSLDQWSNFNSVESSFERIISMNRFGRFESVITTLNHNDQTRWLMIRIKTNLSFSHLLRDLIYWNKIFTGEDIVFICFKSQYVWLEFSHYQGGPSDASDFSSLWQLSD